MDEVNLSGHEDELVHTAVFKVDFSKPTQCIDMEKSGFFADFADGGLFSGFAWFDVAFRDSPAVLTVLNQKNLDILAVFGQAKNDAAGGRFTNYFLNNRLFSEDGFFEFVDCRRTILFWKSFGNFEVTSLPLDRLALRPLCLVCRRLWTILVFHDFLLMVRRQSNLIV